jgi:sugar/nucleoside kinase (ribokinase family)
MPLPAGSIDIVGFGAGAEDLYLPLGVVGDDYVRGAKIGWTEADDVLLAQLRERPFLAEAHGGGNAPNTLGFLACHNSVGANVHLVTQLGTDETSAAIERAFQRIGLDYSGTRNPEYHPSVSIIERADGDRMVRGRPRTPLDDFITDRQISLATSRAHVVVAASLKSAQLADRIFSATPDEAFVSYNPGSSEFNDPSALEEVMATRRPDLLALNDEELAMLFGVDPATVTPELATQMATEASVRFAHNVLCTLGKHGLLLANSGSVTRGAAQIVPTERVVDTLGAGDRAHAVVLDGLLAGRKHDVILHTAAISTAHLVQHVGAHGDLYDKVAA